MRKVMLAFALIGNLVLLQQARPAEAADDHAMPGPPETLAGWAKGARLYPRLGNFHRAITTRSPLAQQYFDQGMRFVWAFNHDEATRSFAKAAEIDPTCASCFWGVALTLGPNYNMPMMNEARARVGGDAVRKARINAKRATPVERALIAAVARRFAGRSTMRSSARSGASTFARCFCSTSTVSRRSTTRSAIRRVIHCCG